LQCGQFGLINLTRPANAITAPTNVHHGQFKKNTFAKISKPRTNSLAPQHEEQFPTAHPAITIFLPLLSL
jgi:hypothetical protein